jgi:hypothetical protein
MLKVSSARSYNEVKSVPLTLGAYLTDPDSSFDSGLDKRSSASSLYSWCSFARFYNCSYCNTYGIKINNTVIIPN